MMAKMFYTMDETKSALGRTEEDIKQLSREGRLREFRDGPHRMFKVDQVESLKSELSPAGGDLINLGPSDTGAPLTMSDSRGAGGSGITLLDTAAGGALGGSVGGVPSPGGSAGGMRTTMKDDTAFADIGLSGTIGGVPSPGRGTTGSGLSGLSGLSGSGQGSRGGITVLDVDDHGHADPSAQTAIGSGISDQVNLEGVGSGSGLLDLTRESDDTSLGAVFDELTPGASAAGARRGGTGMGGTALGGTAAGASGLGMDFGGSAAGFDPMGTASGAVAPQAGFQQTYAPTYNPATAAAPVVIEKPDPSALGFGAAALGAFLVVAFGGFILAGAVLGHEASILHDLRTTPGSNGMMYMLASVGVVVVLFVVGWLVGKATTK